MGGSNLTVMEVPSWPGSRSMLMGAGRDRGGRDGEVFGGAFADAVGMKAGEDSEVGDWVTGANRLLEVQALALSVQV